MTDDLTRAIVEALGCEKVREHGSWDGQPYCAEHEFPWLGDTDNCPTAERVAAAIAPLIEARVREAWADALVRLVTKAKAWHTAQDLCALAIQRAEEVRRG